MAGVTSREAAAELLRLAGEAREVAARVDSVEPAGWALARDVRAIAFGLERYALVAEKAGVAAGEPAPGYELVGAVPA